MWRPAMQRPTFRTMEDLNDFNYFAQVVEHGGFAAAARALGLQKSLLSRRVLALEQRLGVRLLQRTTRSFSVTAIGAEFHTRCLAKLEEARGAEQVVYEIQALPRCVVQLTCPIGLMIFQFGTLLARFMVENPAVVLQVESTNRRVDVIADGIDIAIRVRNQPLEETELVMRRLDDSSQCLVAHPRPGPNNARRAGSAGRLVESRLHPLAQPPFLGTVRQRRQGGDRTAYAAAGDRCHGRPARSRAGGYGRGAASDVVHL